MRPVEILALLVAVLAGTKIIIIFVKPASWKPVVQKTYGNAKRTVPVALLSAAVILSILLKELTIVQIFAVLAFMMAMMMAGASSFGKEITTLSEKLLKDKTIIKKSWPTMVIWFCLSIWVICEILS